MTKKSHNVQAVLDEEAENCHVILRRIREANEGTFTDHCLLGASFARVRKVRDFKDFLVWADERFGIKKSWASRILWLGNHPEEARSLVEEVGDRIDTEGARTKYTPDGVERLRKEKKRKAAKNRTRTTQTACQKGKSQAAFGSGKFDLEAQCSKAFSTFGCLGYRAPRT